MSIPDYETLMLPLLRLTGDGQEHRIGDGIEQLAHEFKLTDEERQQLLPSGKQTTFANRVHWARTYLVQAGLLEATRRAHFKITERGRNILIHPPARITNEYLAQFTEFVAFRARSRLQEPKPTLAGMQAALISPSTQTPDEIIRSTVGQIETALSDEL